MGKQGINGLDDLQFFRLCAAFRLVTADSIAHLLDDGEARDLVSLIRRYGDVLRGGVIEDTGADPSEREKGSAAHLACVLAIDPTDPNIAPPLPILVINRDDFGLLDNPENES